MDRLKPLEVRMARGVAEGKGDDEIARDIGLCSGTVKKYLMNIYRLLDLPDDRNKRVLLAVTYCLAPYCQEGTPDPDKPAGTRSIPEGHRT